MLKRLEKIPEPSKGQKKCLFLCLRVLRSLINVPDLSTLTLNKIILQESVPVLPANDTFWQLAMHALRANDPVTYEFLLVLQLTQQNFPLSDLLQGAFHEDRAVRIITCNFLRCWYAKK